MVFLQRISTCATIPELIREAAEARAAAWSRTAPLAMWCRPSALLVLRGQEGARPATLPVGRSRPALAHGLRRIAAAVAFRACLIGATLLLAATQLLLTAGLLTSGDVGRVLRWSSRLTETAMRLWRRRQLLACAHGAVKPSSRRSESRW